MNKTAVLIAILAAFAWGYAQNLEPIEQSPPWEGGGSGVQPVIWPVSVVNFPDPQNVAGTVDVGNLPEVQAVAILESAPIETVFLDLLDSEVTLLPGEVWESSVFDTSQFNRIGLKVNGIGPYLGCATLWQWDAGDPYFGGDPSFVPTTSSFVQLFGTVDGVHAKIQCTKGFNTSDPATLTWVRVLLRRE